MYSYAKIIKKKMADVHGQMSSVGSVQDLRIVGSIPRLANIPFNWW